LFTNFPCEPEQTTTHDIKNVIKNTRAKGSPGSDKITNLVLKNLPVLYVQYITNITNASIRLSYFPTSWKEATTIMIPKPMKDHKLPENYRPISLLNTLSNNYEIIKEKYICKESITNAK
jgi:hypothetical protein